MMLPIFIGAFSNAVRGGQWRAWAGFQDDEMKWLNSDLLNALIYTILVLALTTNLHLAAASFFFMLLGAAPGWGQMIGAILQGEGAKPFWWGFGMLALRGLFWGICLALPFLAFGYYNIAVHFMVAGSLMPVAYTAAARWAYYRLLGAGEWRGVAWGLGEIFFGAVLWSPLVIK
jgi:hypothetical protein